MDSDEEDEKQSKKSVFPLTMFISEGLKYKRLRQFTKAIASFNSCLEQNPTNEQALLGRSECYMQQGLYDQAKLDAEAALVVNPKSTQAKLLKSEADYFLGDFEKAFLSFRRVHDARPRCGAARLGHQLCRRSIDNSLLPDRAMSLNDEDVNKLTKLLSEDPSDRDIADRSGAPSDSNTYSDDISCLEYMLSHDAYENVHPECRELLAYLENRRHFWRLYKPRTQRRRKRSKSTHLSDDDRTGKGGPMAESSSGKERKRVLGTRAR